MENSDIILNGSEATWSMPQTDGTLGGTYKGTFVFRCYLDPIRELQAGREFRELLGSLSIDAPAAERELAWALTQLKHFVLKSPPFWSSTLQDGGIQGNISDLNIISLVMDASYRACVLFKEKIKADRESVLDKTIKSAEKLLQESNEE